MKKIYLIIILVLVLSSSGVGVFVWSKKKKKKQEKEEALSIVETPDPVEDIVAASKLKSEVPKDLVTDIIIDYVDTGNQEIGYKMHYKGVSHEGTFRAGDPKVFIKKSLASFAVFQLRKNEPGKVDDSRPLNVTIKAGANNVLKNPSDGIKSIEDLRNEKLVYLFISNNKGEVIKGLKVSLYTGDQIKGLPKDWPELD